jgi:hypothetical protein
MRFFEATSRIAAEPAAVWSVLVDGPGWAQWDSGVDAVDGRIAPGEKITIRSKVAPGRAFPVRVTGYEPPRLLRFRGGMPLGLFTGVRTYTLSADDAGGTAFHMREEYTGALLGLIWRSMPDLGPSFRQFADGLKKRVEAGG